MVYLLLFLLLGFSTEALADQSQYKPFAVIELFSSEGCSSCAPADLLVSKITAWARQNNEAVYPLIFHVDYWNNLGWRDVFSRAEFTERQQQYAKVFKDQGVYTPEMVVNGTDAFIGSDANHLKRDLKTELSLPTTVGLEVSLKLHEDKAIIHCKATDFVNGDVVNVALIERGLTTEVTAGENSGRDLHHDNIVREFKSVPLTAEATEVKIPIYRVSDPAQASILVYVQNPQTMMIEAAKQLDLEND